MSEAVAAAVTHWGKREGGAEMWARVSWPALCSPAWLRLAQQQDAGQRKGALHKEEEGVPEQSGASEI